MATTTGTTVIYDAFLDALGDASHNLGSDVLKVLLTTSTYTPNASTHSQLSDITNEVSGNGYARQTLSSVTWSGGTLDAANPVWTASGGSIVARYWVLFNDTSTNDLLIAYGLLDNSPADVTTTDGNTLTLTFNASGIFTIS